MKSEIDINIFKYGKVLKIIGKIIFDSSPFYKVYKK